MTEIMILTLIKSLPGSTIIEKAVIQTNPDVYHFLTIKILHYSIPKKILDFPKRFFPEVMLFFHFRFLNRTLLKFGTKLLY